MSEKKDKIPTTDVSNTPNGRKLKQTRITFKPVESRPKGGTPSHVAGESRKRKLSTTDDDNNRSIKLSKTGAAKENIKKTDEVTVLEMVDLVDSDIDMTDKDVTASIVPPKETEKSTKDEIVEVTQTPLRRSNRKNDSDVPAKVVIKIPSAKKKKVNERLSKVAVVAKIVENDEDDDDVVLIDSEENSLNSVDGKEKDFDTKVDSSIVPTDSEISFVLDGDTGSNLNTAESTESVVVKEISGLEAADSSDKHEIDAPAVKEPDVAPEDMATEEPDVATEDMVTEDKNVSIVEADTNQLDASIADQSNAKGENLLADVNEANSSDSDSVAEAKMDTDFDESKVSTPNSTVEKRKRRTVNVMNTPKTPTMKTTDQSSLTPKQQQKKLESEQKRLAKEKAKEERERKIQEAKEERERKIQEAKEERERKIQEAKEERERKQQEEKEQRQRERDEKEKLKKKERDDKEEQKRKEREDKEEQRRKEKEEREKKKQEEIDAKNEEKRKKEEERVAKEEAELKKKRKEVEAFTKFFAKKSNKSDEKDDKMDVDDDEVQLNFMPFRVKPDMRLAPIVRRQLSPTRKSKFDDEVLNSSKGRPSTDLYIDSLRNSSCVSEKQGKTWPNEENNDDVILIDELEGSTSIEETSPIQKYRAKFFKFEENRRPPYYGTWQKKSSVITPRRPFATDEKFFDYEVDSDDEWEDEEPGESLHGSDDEKDKESDDDYDIDNEFFVPHGHLSDEELANNDEIDEDNTPDTQKAKLKIMQKVFCDEMKKKTEKIKPRLIGLIWQNKDGGQPAGCPSLIWEMLQVRSMIFNGSTIVIPIVQSGNKNDAADENAEAKKGSAVKKRIKLAEECVPELIRLIHGNTNSSEFLSKEFRVFTAQKNKDDDKFQEFSLTSIRLKIKELAEWKPCPEEGPMMNKFCWYVSSEQRKHYSMDQLSIVNDWMYTLTPKSKLKSESKKAKENEKVKSPPDAPDELPASVKTPKSKLGNIEKFTKILSDDDKKKNFSIVQELPVDVPAPAPKPKTTDAEPSPKPAKKRVKLLMSVPRGQEIPVQTKNSLISQYLSSKNSNKKSTDAGEPICIDD